MPTSLLNSQARAEGLSRRQTQFWLLLRLILARILSGPALAQVRPLQPESTARAPAPRTHSAYRRRARSRSRFGSSTARHREGRPRAVLHVWPLCARLLDGDSGDSPPYYRRFFRALHRRLPKSLRDYNHTLDGYCLQLCPACGTYSCSRSVSFSHNRSHSGHDRPSCHS